MKKDVYLGKEYSDKEILGMISANIQHIDYVKLSMNKICKKVAKLIYEQNIVGWFQGGSESGPRALGNRSILADARNPYMKDRINTSVKHREWYRPFAPSCFEEEAHKYFNHTTKSPHMLLISNVKEEWKTRLPAITHVDGTARLQTVSKDTNKNYWQVIKEFEKLSGVAVILNTSFNDNEEPIVEMPGDAINCFTKNNMDYLVMGHYFISKKKRNINHLKPLNKERRVGIVCFSYNRSSYLEKTLDSLIKTMDKRDVLFLLEQSSDPEEKKRALEFTKKAGEKIDIIIYDMPYNLGCRLGTDRIWESGAFNDCEYYMNIDHDMIIKEPLTTGVEKLDSSPYSWIVTYHNSPEHDIMNVDGDWLLKDHTRGCHMMLRIEDFLKMMPIWMHHNGGNDNINWHGGLDWYLMDYAEAAPGPNTKEIIAVLPGASEHIGRDSAWQGEYDDEYTEEDEKMFLKVKSMKELLGYYRPDHRYDENTVFWYEKEYADIING